jgi:UPF0755 protein
MTDNANPTPFAPPPRRGCLRRLIRAAVICIVLIALAAGAVSAVFWQWSQNETRDTSSAPIKLEIEKGDSLLRIADRLHEKELIDRPGWFILLAVLRRDDKDLQSGRFQIQPGISPAAILDRLLESGQAPSVTVTFPEGWTLRQMAERLTDKGLVDTPEDFIKTAQNPGKLKILGEFADRYDTGYLFPDTYFFSPEAGSEAIAHRMVERFREVMNEIMPGFPDSPTTTAEGLNAGEVLILASIIEREARRHEEMPLIASVYHNRLRRGMRLDSCATVRHALDKWHAPLTRKDLEVESDWNTYRRKGLPPGPICNPGRAALEAAARPEESDFLYYVYRGDGRHYFSKTLQEHQAATKRYREYWSFSAGSTQSLQPALPPE